VKDIDENGVDRMDRFRGYSQRFNQFSVTDEVYRETLEYMKHLREQRDEARREWCYMESCRRCEYAIEPSDEDSIAAERGWDCFKEEESC
jgi:hypothetical protein